MLEIKISYTPYVSHTFDNMGLYREWIRLSATVNFSDLIILNIIE